MSDDVIWKKGPGKDFLLYHHLGMGDHLVANALVRLLYRDKSFEKFHLIVQKKYEKNVRHMFGDLSNLLLISVEEGPSYNFPEAESYFNNFTGEKLKHFVVPWSIEVGIYADDCLYQHPAVNYHKDDKYNFFKINRSQEREDEVFNKIINFADDYAFVHDDPLRGYVINSDEYIDPRLKIIRTSELLEYSMFDLMGVMEYASQFHTFISSFSEIMIANEWEVNKYPRAFVHNSYMPIERDGRRRVSHPTCYEHLRNRGCIIL